MAKKQVTAPDGAVTEVDDGVVTSVPWADPETDAEPVAESVAEPVDGEFVDMVTVTVPHDYQLRLDNFHMVQYKTGVQEMERAHAEHFYSKAHGVTIYQK